MQTFGVLLLCVEIYTQYMEFNVSNEDPLLNQYFESLNSAAPDTGDYSTLNGILKYGEGRSMYYYSKFGMDGYNVEIFSFDYVGLIMRVHLLSGGSLPWHRKHLL
jgi:hypothetical protein